MCIITTYYHLLSCGDLAEKKSSSYPISSAMAARISAQKISRRPVAPPTPRVRSANIRANAEASRSRQSASLNFATKAWERVASTVVRLPYLRTNGYLLL
jgi:hypothetical protein